MNTLPKNSKIKTSCLGILFTVSSVFLIVVLVQAVNRLNVLTSAVIDQPGYLLSPGRYEKNEHTIQKQWIEKGEYRFEYVFRDHKGKNWKWEWGYNKKKTDQAIAEFGIPASFYKPYRPTPDVIKKRKERLKAGFFKKEGQYITPDYSAMTKRYMEFAYPLYLLARQSLKTYAEKDRIHFLLKFLQDIPYGVPPGKYNGKVISGIIPPPQIFTEGWGDCDSKGILFSSILAHYPGTDLVFIFVPKHVFLGIRGVPRPYQDYVTYKGKQYIFMEPVGTARTAFGKANSNYVTIKNISPLVMEKPSSAKTSAYISQPLKSSIYISATGLNLVEDTQEDYQVNLMMKSVQPMVLVADIQKNGQKLKNQVFVQKTAKNEYRLHARVNEPGQYNINVYAKKKGQRGTYPFAFNYPFESAAKTSDSIVFPQAYQSFMERDVQLYSPLSGQLIKGKKYLFKLNLPGAKAASIILGRNRYDLKKNGSLFERELKVKTDEATVYVLYHGEKQLTGILKYEVVTSSKAESRETGNYDTTAELPDGYKLLGAKQEESQVVLSIKTSQPKSLIAELVKGRRKLKGQTFVQEREPGIYEIFAGYNRAGSYTINIYASPKGQENTSYPFAFEFPFKSQTNTDKRPSFPTPYIPFSKHGGVLISPMTGNLKIGSVYTFKVNLPGAEKVAVIIGQDWKFLKKEGTLFTEKITINKASGGNIGVFAKFPDATQYSGILGYRVY